MTAIRGLATTTSYSYQTGNSQASEGDGAGFGNLNLSGTTINRGVVATEPRQLDSALLNQSEGFAAGQIDKIAQAKSVTSGQVSRTGYVEFGNSAGRNASFTEAEGASTVLANYANGISGGAIRDAVVVGIVEAAGIARYGVASEGQRSIASVKDFDNAINADGKLQSAVTGNLHEGLSRCGCCETEHYGYGQTKISNHVDLLMLQKESHLFNQRKNLKSEI